MSRLLIQNHQNPPVERTPPSEPQSPASVHEDDGRCPCDPNETPQGYEVARAMCGSPGHWKLWAGFLCTETPRPGNADSGSNHDSSDSYQDSPGGGADAAELPQASRNSSADSLRGAEDAVFELGASQAVTGDALALQKASPKPFRDARLRSSAISK